MSKKNLLNETQVRKFMKLASLEPLTPGFVGGLTEKAAFKKGEETESGEEAYVNESDDELDERRQTRPPGGGPGGGGTSHGRSSETMPDSALMREEELEDEIEFDVDAGELEDVGDEEDMEVEDEVEVEEPVDDMGDAGRMVDVDDFLSALESALEDVMDDEVEIDSDEVEDVAAVEEPVVDVEDEMEVDVEQEDELMERQNDLVETVTKRVAARILKEALQTRPPRSGARKAKRRTKK